MRRCLKFSNTSVSTPGSPASNRGILTPSWWIMRTRLPSRTASAHSIGVEGSLGRNTATTDWASRMRPRICAAKLPRGGPFQLHLDIRDRCALPRRACRFFNDRIALSHPRIDRRPISDYRSSNIRHSFSSLLRTVIRDARVDERVLHGVVIEGHRGLDEHRSPIVKRSAESNVHVPVDAHDRREHLPRRPRDRLRTLRAVVLT